MGLFKKVFKSKSGDNLDKRDVPPAPPKGLKTPDKKLDLDSINDIPMPNSQSQAQSGQNNNSGQMPPAPGQPSQSTGSDMAQKAPLQNAGPDIPPNSSSSERRAQGMKGTGQNQTLDIEGLNIPKPDIPEASSESVSKPNQQNNQSFQDQKRPNFPKVQKGMLQNRIQKQSKSKEKDIGQSVAKDLNEIKSNKEGLQRPKKLEGGPLFVEANCFAKVMGRINSSRRNLKDLEEISTKINDINDNKDRELQNYRDILENIEKKILVVDKMLFKGE